METVRGWLRRLRYLLGAVGHGSGGDAERLRRGLSLVADAAHAAGWTSEDDVWRFAAHRSAGQLLLSNTSWPYALPGEAPMT